MTNKEVSLTFYPLNRKVTVERGTTVLEASSKARITINNLCGGDGICGRCRMIVLKGEVSGEISGKLTRDEIKSGYILACMTRVENDLVVEIPAETLAKEKARSDEDADRFKDFKADLPHEEFKVLPLVQKIFLNLSPPTLADNTADQQRVSSEIKRRLNVPSMQMGLKIIKSLSKTLRDNDYRITATVGLRKDIAEVMNIEAGDTEKSNYMIVIDIGTTTIVAHLIDVSSLKTLDATACFNSQGIYGRDVITRIIASEKKGSEGLQKLLIDDINNLIMNLSRNTAISLKDITAVVCSGNTTMSHFLLGLPTENIRRYPYIPVTVEPPPLRAAEVGININPRGLLYSLPGISGWVGSDITAGILATGLYKRDEVSLLIDIGTNGEIVLGNREWLVATSSSAGPALEGASLACGMRAEPGAIEGVSEDGQAIRYRTIDGKSPKGICGSGIIDLIAVLFRMGLINRAGKFIAENDVRITMINEKKAFVIANEQATGLAKPVYITESDIENIITAKAAIYAAMKILMLRLDLDFAGLSHLFIAGAFGNYLDIENAITIGLIPDLPRDKISFAGNTSLAGAKITAFYKEAFQKITEIRKMTTYYDLMAADDYVEEFKRAMFLPHTDIEDFPSVKRKGNP